VAQQRLAHDQKAEADEFLNGRWTATQPASRFNTWTKYPAAGPLPVFPIN